MENLKLKWEGVAVFVSALAHFCGTLVKQEGLDPFIEKERRLYNILAS